MKHLLISLGLTCLFCLICTDSFSQSTLDMNYNQLQEYYKSKPSLNDWKEGFAGDGTFYISMWDKDGAVSLFHYFNNGKQGKVMQYRLISDAQTWANIWGEYADKHFVKQRLGVWYDYSTNTKWMLDVKGDTACFAAEKMAQ